MGDYNINLLNKLLNNIPDSQYEECIYSSGYAPLISLATHIKPNCKDSCIDNIHSNETESILLTGTLSDNISHHLPIFQFSDINTPIHDSKQPVKVLYDFRNCNVDKVIAELSETIPFIVPSPKFTEFTEHFENILNKHCKLDNPRTTKRSPVNNPWIIEGLITSIKRKHELKSDWIASKSKKCQNGCPLLHEKFITYQRNLKKLICKGKAVHMANKFDEFKNDCKRT